MIQAKWNKQVNSLYKKLDKLKITSIEGQKLAVQEATLLVHSTAVKSLQETSKGKVEKRYNPDRTVIVSAPGDAPNTDTGRAVQSIKFDFQNEGFIGRVGTNLRYLRMLELGTRFIAPRPWLSLAVNQNLTKIKNIFRKRAQTSLKDIIE